MSELLTLVEEPLPRAADAFRSAILDLRHHSRACEQPGIKESQWRARQTVLAQAHYAGSVAVQRTIDDIAAVLHRIFCGELEARQWQELADCRDSLRLAFLGIYLSRVDEDRLPGHDRLQADRDDADEQCKDFTDLVLRIVASANADAPGPPSSEPTGRLVRCADKPRVQCGGAPVCGYR
ncbi:hypothetical protein ACQP1P_33200 [Dactylosporangium sp. CA-052675]|uniref:hypothetical protein n=1 Tax=Dactylosporangium sp. CA-052675 TaxID=3239927 RepID=UPI003D932785